MISHTQFLLIRLHHNPDTCSPELLKTYKRLEQSDEEKGNEKGKNKKAKAEKGKSKPQSRSKKRNADADADTDSDDDAAGKAARSPKPKMPVPKNNRSNKKPKQAAKQKKPKVDYTANPGQFVKLRVAKDFGVGNEGVKLFLAQSPASTGMKKMIMWSIGALNTTTEIVKISTRKI